MMRRLRPPAALAVLALAGCSTTGSSTSPLIPDKKLQLTANTHITLSRIVTAAVVLGAINFIYDPRAQLGNRRPGSTPTPSASPCA